MNRYPIKTVEYHEKQLEDCQSNNRRRLDLDVSDVALSTWADATMVEFHRLAIAALKRGAENGIDGPAGYFPRLYAVEYEKEVELDARLVSGQYGLVWLLSDKDAERFGRRFIPTGKGSRVQRKLGLREDTVLAPAERFAEPSGADFIGAPIFFSLVEKRPKADPTPAPKSLPKLKAC